MSPSRRRGWRVRLTQALGAQIFFGSNGCRRNVSRRNFGTTARLAFQTVDRQRPCIGNLIFPELASQLDCRPPPTLLATGCQRQAPANSRAIPSSQIICYASLTTQSRGTAIVPMSVPLFPALGAHIFFGSNGRSRKFSRRNVGVVATLALRKLGGQLRGPGISPSPESAPQPACRPPPTSLATSRQR